MKNIKMAVATFAIALSLGSAHAIPVVHTYDPADVLMTFGGQTSGVSFTHNILSGFTDMSANFYVPGVDTITSARMDVTVTDTGGSEQYTYSLDGIFFANFSNVPSSRVDVLLFPNLSVALNNLSADGLLNVVLTVTNGSFTFDKSVLTAEITKGTPGQSQQVPEPATLSMVGIGLLGLAAMRRRRMSGRK